MKCSPWIRRRRGRCDLFVLSVVLRALMREGGASKSAGPAARTQSRNRSQSETPRPRCGRNGTGNIQIQVCKRIISCVKVRFLLD
jgi:hypothetical protein